MATVLKRELPLNFTSGNILALKPTPLAKPPASFEFALALANKKDDILLYIAFCTEFIKLSDRACRSLGDGWGESHKVDMAKVDLKGQSLLAVKVSIHHYLTDSGFGRYQVLFDGITIAHCEKRFPGPATKIVYCIGTLGPPSWDVNVYQVDDLLPKERLALGPER